MYPLALAPSPDLSRPAAAQVLPEFKHRLVVDLDEQPPFVNSKLTHDLCLPHVIIPAGSKLLVGPENGGMGHGPPSACDLSQPCSGAPHTDCIERQAPLCGSDALPSPSSSHLNLVSPMATSTEAEATLTRGNPKPSLVPKATSPEAGRLSNDPPLTPKATSPEAGLPEPPPLILTP